MRTHRTRFLMLGVFVLTLGAGVVAGLLASRLPTTTAHADVTLANDSAPLAEQLGLTNDQRDQMRKIWEGVRDLSNVSYENARKAESERDDAIAALIPAEN